MNIDNIFNSFVPMTILFVFVIVLFFAMKSKSDGSEILKLFKRKRFLGLEISQAFLALSEGMLAAAIGMELDHVPYGVRLTGHIALICTSAFAGFQLGDQVKEAREADSDNAIKEWMDVFWSVILTVLPPFANVAYIAFSLKAYKDINAFFTFDWGRISSALVALTCFIFVIHVVVVLYLATATAGKKEKSNVDSNGGTAVPLTLASDSDIDDDAAEDTDDEEESTPAPNTDVIPYSRIPNVNDLINYVKTHFSNRVDINAFEQKMRTDDRFMDRVAVKIEDALKARDKWDDEKAKLNSYTTDLRSKQSLLSARQATKRSFSKAYNVDTANRVVQGIEAEIDSLNEQITAIESKIAVSSALVDSAEDAYNVKLDLIGDLLDTL